MVSSHLEGGFADPVFDAQATFRTIMDAMARPGTLGTFAPIVSPPRPMGLAMGAIASALIDVDTPFWLDATLDADGAIRNWLAFHTGASATQRAAASFALVGDASALDLAGFALGSQEYPDRSATVLVEVPDLHGGQPLTLQGPGIDQRIVVSPQGLPADFAAQWAGNTGLFPRGVDLILTCGSDIICLPRSTRLARREG